MHIGTWLTRAPARASFACALAFVLHAGSAAGAPAAAPAAAPPVAISTLDVCANEATGKWRYSGVIAVQGAAPGVIAVDNRIQNGGARSGYADALRATSVTVHAPLRAGETTVVPYTYEAAPLLLGVTRSVATLRLPGTALSPGLRTLLVQSGIVTADSVCGCAPKGCVRTQGYWGNKPGVVWPAPYDRNAPFFSSGLTWQQILDTPPRGSGYLILAKQYIAAVLNRAAGASAPSGVQSVIDAAATWFRSGTTPASCGPGQCAQQIAWAATLDLYNNGAYPGAPRHCD